MKSTLKLLITAAITIWSIFQLEAQGYIVPNGVVVNFDGLFSPNEIDVLHDPSSPTSGSSYTGFELDPTGANAFLFNPVVDVGVRVFLVSPNDSISLQPILSQNYTELLYPNNYVFNEGVPFYAGLYTGNQSYAPPNGIYTDPLFGWAELENVNGSIQLLNSALEYGGDGIYAGTQNIITAVPEPNSFGLFAVGGLFVAWRLWWKSSLKVSPNSSPGEH